MSKRLARDIAAFLELNERYKSWERLPEQFLRRSERLSGERVVQVAVDLWKRGAHRYLWAAVTLLRTHPTAFRRLRWRPLEEMGNRMGHWGTSRSALAPRARGSGPRDRGRSY
jgi:hypothetical protein